MHYDIVIVGAGTAGIPAAIFAGQRGARVCLIEHAPEIGGCLLINRGQMSGAGTALQAARGIVDSPDRHYQDVLRISRDTADRGQARLACDLQGGFIDWLMASGFEMLPDMPRILYGHEAYDVERIYWGREEGRSILAVLRPLLEAEIARGSVDLFVNCKAEALLRGTDGGIEGVVDDRGGCYRGTSVLLATGGYGANKRLFEALHPGSTLWSGAYHYANGAGLEMAIEAGASLLHTEKYHPSFGGVLDHTLPVPRYRSPGGLVPQDRAQWEIVVNRRGERFYAEDGTSADLRAERLAQQPEYRAWVIFDQHIRDTAPNLFWYFGAEKAAEFYRENPHVHTAPDLAGLAVQAGIDPQGLQHTVDAYNLAVETGSDALGRKFLPAPIEQGPYYAVGIFAYTVRSFGGLAVSPQFEVLDGAGRAIKGLYAAGEILGSAISGAGAVGGMGLTPALVFGRLLGEKILPVGSAAGVATGGGARP